MMALQHKLELMGIEDPSAVVQMFSEQGLDVDTCEAFEEFRNLGRHQDVSVIQTFERFLQQAGCSKKDQTKLALWSFLGDDTAPSPVKFVSAVDHAPQGSAAGGADTAPTPALPAVDHSLLGPAAVDTSPDLPPFDANANVSAHAEGQRYLQPPGSWTGNYRFHDQEIQRAAGVALAEGQDGSGHPLVNADGSLHTTADTSPTQLPTPASAAESIAAEALAPNEFDC